MEKISAHEAAKSLGISLEDLRILEKQGLIHSSRNSEGVSFYSAQEIEEIISRRGLSISDEAAKVNAQIQKETVYSISNFRKIFIGAGGLAAGYLLLAVVLATLFMINPAQTSDFFGYYYRFNAAQPQASLVGEKEGNVLAASTGPPAVAATQRTVLADVLEPVAAASLVAVKAVNGQRYAEIVTNPVEAAGLGGLQGSQGPPGPGGANGIDGATGLQGPAGSQGVTGASGSNGTNGTDGTDGTNGTNGTNGTSVADVMTTAGDVIIRNAGNITSRLGVGSAGQVLTITGGVPAWENSGAGSSFSGLTGGTNTTASMIVGSGGSLGFSGTGTINASSINGATLGTTTAISGNLLIGSGTQWITKALSGDATIDSSGALTLKSVGTAGTYGGAASIPVITTDSQGRVSGVTATTISGLTNSNLSGTAGITNGQLANSSITTAGNSGAGSVSLGGGLTFTGAGITNIVASGSTLTVTSTEADTLASVTGRGTTTATNITTTGTGAITSAGLLTASNGLTVTTGAVSLPAGSIGNAALSNSSLTVTAGNGLSGGGSISLGGSTSLAVGLTTSGTTGSTSSNSGLEVGAGGLTLLHGCADGELMKWSDVGGWACAADVSGGTPALNTIAAATAANIPINNGDYAQVWNWGLTTAAKTAFTFGENAASTSGAGSQYILGISTLAGSTAAPLKISARGNTIIDTTNTGGLTFGNTTANTPITLQSGTGAINIGTDANAKIIGIGTTAGTTAVNINSGTGNINFTVDGTGSSGSVRIGNSGTTTPDLLVLDNGTADPTGVNGGIYYNTSTNKFRCYENSAWKNCDASIPRSSSITDSTSDALSTTEAEIMDGTAPSITPQSTSNRVLIIGSVQVRQSVQATHTTTIRIRRGSGSCAGTQVDGDLTTTDIGNNSGDFPSTKWVSFSLIDAPSTTSSQSYTICGLDSTNTSSNTTPYLTMSLIEVAATGADLAELYPTTDYTLAPGDIVSLDPSLTNGVQKSGTAYDKKVIGIISTAPGMTIGSVDDNRKPVPVALSGRVPVKVNTENGAIKTGDMLTSSSTPGVGMKATKAGAIIGTAMASFDGDGIGTIIVFVKNGTSLGNNTEGINTLMQLLGSPSNNNSNILDNSQTATEASSSASLADMESTIGTNLTNYITRAVSDLFKKTVEFFGNVIFHSDVTFLGRPTFNKDTAGFAVVKSGDSEVEVKFDKEYASEPVVTLSLNIAGAIDINSLPQFVVADVNTKGFKIKMARSLPMDIRFSWMAIAVSETNKFESSGGVVTTPIPSATINPEISPVEILTPTATPSSTMIQENLPTSTQSASSSAQVVQ